MPADISRKQIKDFLKPRLGARLKTWVEICTHCGLCADSCHFYLAHDREPRMIPSHKVRFLKELLRFRCRTDKAFFEEIYRTVYHECTLCRRCTLFCPFGIDIGQMISLLRQLLFHCGIVPTELSKIVENYQATGNQMAVSKEDWVETLQWCEEEITEEVPGLKIPIDNKGAKIMYTVNAREPKFYPQDIMQAAKIFHAAGEDWTVPSETGWCNTNMAMYAGDLATAKMLAANVFEQAEELGARQIVVTECGHAFRSLKYEAPLWLGYTPKQEVVHSIELFHDYLCEGRIKLKNRLKTPTTVQDPCNVCRNGGLSFENRHLAEMLCEDFRPMSLQGNYNYCCSGGGGVIAMGGETRKQRMQAGKVKADQIKATGAEIVLTGCHNCIDQIRDLNKEYQLGIKALHFKEVIAEHMEIPA